MTVAEMIAAEVRNLPEDMAQEVLDFVLFLEGRQVRKASTLPAPDWDVVRIDTVGWRFNRDEANAR